MAQLTQLLQYEVLQVVMHNEKKFKGLVGLNMLPLLCRRGRFIPHSQSRYITLSRIQITAGTGEIHDCTCSNITAYRV